MTEDLTERKIFELMLSTYRFRETKHGVTCLACGRRLMKKTIGRPINERMIDHHDSFHNRRPK